MLLYIYIFRTRSSIPFTEIEYIDILQLIIFIYNAMKVFGFTLEKDLKIGIDHYHRQQCTHAANICCGEEV